MKKYNYNDWWEGKVYLETCAIFLKTTERTTKCQLTDFELTDRLKIKEKQEEIFITAVNELLEKWQVTFNNKYAKSECPEILIQRELDYFKSIIYYDISSLPFNTARFIIKRNDGNSLIFEPIEFITIRSYIDEIIIGGQENEPNFIHSPNFQYQRKDLIAPAQVYAKVLWDYLNWLTIFSPYQFNHDKKKNKQIENTINRIDLEFEKIIDRCFVSESDYENFRKLLLNFFIGNPFTLPAEIINLKRDCKTKIAAALNSLHKDLAISDRTLRSDKEYYDIIRTLNHFKNLPNIDIYKLLTK